MLSLTMEMNYKQIPHIFEVPMYLTLSVQSLSGAEYQMRGVHTARGWKCFTPYQPGRVL
jgi:hypothetical protein